VIRAEKHDGTTEIKLKGLSQTIMVFKSLVTNMKPKTNLSTSLVCRTVGVGGETTELFGSNKDMRLDSVWF